MQPFKILSGVTVVIGLCCVVAALLLIAIISAFYALTILSGIALAQFIVAVALAMAATMLIQKLAWPWMRKQWS